MMASPGQQRSRRQRTSKIATNLIKVGYDWTYVSSGNAPAVEQVNAAFTTVAPVGVTVTGNSITKTAMGGSGNAGTFSDQVITADGSVSTTVAETNTARTIGLSDSDTDVSYSSIDYALICGPMARFVSMKTALTRGGSVLMRQAMY